MIQFTKLNIEGFCSIPNLSLDLNTTGITIIRGVNGEGKAQPLYEPVLTSKGWKKMGDLTLKDKIINPVTGRPIPLNSIHDRGKLPTYRVSFDDGTYTECAGDHLWSVYKSGKTRYRLCTLDTLSLLEDYKIENKSVPGTYKYRYSIPLTQPIEYSKKDLPIHPYVLGFILGDGCISGNSPIVRVSTNEKDCEEVVSRLRSYLPDPNMVHMGTNPSKGNIRHFRIHGLGKELRGLGLIGKKSANKFIPKIYLKSSIEDRKLLLAGLLDTDGHSGSKSKISKVSTYDSKSKVLRDGVVELVRSLGGISRSSVSARFKYGRYTTTYSCSIRMNYIPFLRNYKKEEFGNFTRRNRMVKVIRNIEYIGLQEVRCITVDSPDGLYITRDYTVTHNSSIFSALVWGLYGKTPKDVSDVNTWEKLRKKDYQGTKVEVYFLKNNQVHRVIRCLNYKGNVDGAKGSSRLIYDVDANPISEKYKPKIQAKIAEALEMSYNLFINSVMFGQGITRLIEETGTEQKNLFEEIFSLNYLTKARDIAKAQYNKYEKEAYEVNHQLDILHNQVKMMEDNLKYVQDYQKTEGKRRKEKIDELRREKSLSTRAYEKLARDVDSIEQQNIDRQISEHQNLISKNRTKLKEARASIGIPLEELIDKVIDLLEKKEYDSSMKYLRSLKSAFSKIESLQSKLTTLEKALMNLRVQESKLTVLQRDLKRHKEKIETLKQRIKEQKSSPMIQARYSSEDIQKAKKEIEKLENSQVNQMKELYKWLYTDPLGNNGIKAFLFESSMDSLNQTLESFSNIIGMTIQFGMDLQSARKDFQVYINIEGQDVDFNELSGGQKQLASLAIAFAMNEAMTQAKGINIAFLDEVFESLSANNIELVSDLIRKIYKNKTLFLITHQESLPISNARVLRVKRIDGLSHYEF